MNFFSKFASLLRYPLSIAFLLVLPFFILVRGSVFFYHLGWTGYLALLLASLLTVFVLVIYFIFVDRWYLTQLYVPLSIKISTVAIMILAFNAHGLLIFSKNNVKDPTLISEFTQVHPLLRLAVSTVSYFDGSMIVTDMSRTREDYKSMGLSALENSLHYVQKDNYVHAVDFRTMGRGNIHNWLMEKIFVTLGFNSLRHVGTADHLHISLPIYTHNDLNLGVTERLIFSVAVLKFVDRDVLMSRALRPTWMWEGRATQDDSREGISRVESGTETEQLPRCVRATLAIEQLLRIITPCHENNMTHIYI